MGNIIWARYWYNPDAWEFWSKSRVTEEDLFLARQPVQIHRVRIRLYPKYGINSIGVFEGKLLSMDFSMDANSAIRRTCSLKFATKLDEDLNFRDIGLNQEVQLEEGILNLKTGVYKWYNKGHFVISNYNFSLTNTERIVSLSLSDFMTLINGERDGVIKGYNPSIEVIDYNQFYKDKMDEYESAIANAESDSERKKYITKVNDLIKQYSRKIPIEDAMDDITYQFYRQTSYGWAWEFMPVTNDAGVNTALEGEWYDPLQDNFTIPYDINFNTGVTLYEVLDKLTHLYPAYELFFDECHCLRNRRKPTEEVVTNRMATFMLKEDFEGLIIDEQINRDMSQIWNSCTVYGKDGIYKGTAELLERVSYAPDQIGLIHKEFAGEEYSMLTSDDECWDWAYYLLEQNTCLHDNLTVTLVNCPFINDVNYKVDYPTSFLIRDWIWNDSNPNGIVPTTVTCVITNVATSFENNTTTLTMTRVDLGSINKPHLTLETPVILSHQLNILSSELQSVTLELSEVPYAEKYIVYANGKQIATSTNHIITCSFTESQEGMYALYVIADNENFYNSNPSEPIYIQIDFAALKDNNDEFILDSNGDLIKDSSSNV